MKEKRKPSLLATKTQKKYKQLIMAQSVSVMIEDESSSQVAWSCWNKSNNVATNNPDCI